MPKQLLLFLAALGFLVVGLACNTLLPPMTDTETSNETSSPECITYSADYHVSSDSDGKSITMNVGQTIAVSLSSNTSTGFEWTVRNVDAKYLRFDGKSYAGWNPMPGSGGAESLCFMAIAKGHTKLELAYLRTFEPTSIPPFELYSVDISIQ